MRCAERDAQKQETTATSCLHFATMAESFTPSVSCRNMQCVPDISFRDIEEFSCRSSSKRNHERGYNYFAEKYYSTYGVSVSVTKAVSDGCYTCANGQSGHCGHIVGLLYQLAHFKITGTNYIPEVILTMKRDDLRLFLGCCKNITAPDMAHLQRRKDKRGGSG
ncbi:uncharacterized protein LOC112571536 [Pomacea canaliculata]|uniref:uncharacterized protein LOC112571536 n=1 Tax=Pomacea canaliculata TaxID=400727 RepID=UPI000D730A06|nr:uncharacterized protein LOC112571536 [Pomacea canaliculata]